MINTKSIKIVKCCLLYIVIIFICGCATKMSISPQVTEINNVLDFHMKGKVEYDGKKEYLPRIITNESVPGTDLSFQYTYDITYGRDKTNQLVPLFNPLTLVGFPIGENTLVVNGKLTILKGKEVMKEYMALCGLERRRNIFSEGDTFTELREKGLLNVRNNIEVQKYQDMNFISKLTYSD